MIEKKAKKLVSNHFETMYSDPIHQCPISIYYRTIDRDTHKRVHPTRIAMRQTNKVALQHPWAGGPSLLPSPAAESDNDHCVSGTE
jgi:hypothetical protein